MSSKTFSATRLAALVDGVTKLSRANFSSREEKQAENFRKMLLAMGKDVRVILIKLADRVHNMRTLDHMPPEKQILTAQETLDIYAPFAPARDRLDQDELEDLALQVSPSGDLLPAQAQRREEKNRPRKIYRRSDLGHSQEARSRRHRRRRDRAGRRHFYSIYQKMESQNLLYDQIYDLVAFRILVDTLRECYEALGVVHSQWKPVPGRFKDYIALPKAEYVSIAAYERDRALRRAHRDPDPHP